MPISGRVIGTATRQRATEQTEMDTSSTIGHRRGYFVAGTDTGVGKTYVAALLARQFRSAGLRVGVYKPAASGCRREAERLVSDDAVALWEAAGRPESLEAVCPQVFEAPLAPHLAARAEGRRLDPQLLRSGLERWPARSDVLLVEGAGGLFSPISDDDLVADLACEFGLPLIVVARDALGTINHTLLTLHAARTYRGGLAVAGVVLNQTTAVADDPSRETNGAELHRLAKGPPVVRLGWQGQRVELPGL